MRPPARRPPSWTRPGSVGRAAVIALLAMVVDRAKRITADDTVVVISGVTPNPTSAGKPTVTVRFNSDGNVLSSGACTAVSPGAISAGGTFPKDVTVTLSVAGDNFPDGVYTDCQVGIERMVSGTLEAVYVSVGTFTIDRTVQTPLEGDGLRGYVNDPTPTFFMTFYEAGTVTVGGAVECGLAGGASEQVITGAGEHAITLAHSGIVSDPQPASLPTPGSDLPEGSMRCTLLFKDSLGNIGSTSAQSYTASGDVFSVPGAVALTEFVIDVQALNGDEISPVAPATTYDGNPETILSFPEAGYITVGGTTGCGLRRVELPPSSSCSAGSPSICVSEFVSINGQYSPGGLVSITDGMLVARANQVHSCPPGWKIMSPRSADDWRAVYNSVDIFTFANPDVLIDISRPADHCGGCTDYPMNSNEPGQTTDLYPNGWRTTDGSPWHLRQDAFPEPNGDYTANCFLGILCRTALDLDGNYDGDCAAASGQGSSYCCASHITFNDLSCNYKSSNYLCQPSTRSFVNAGEQRLVFSTDGNGDPLDGGVYNCTVTFTDLAGNVAPNMLNLTGFQVLCDPYIAYTDGQHACITKTVCKPGEYIDGETGPEHATHSPRMCKACPADTYSNAENQFACANWATSCGDDAFEISPPTASNDRVCSKSYNIGRDGTTWRCDVHEPGACSAKPLPTVGAP